MNCENKFPDRLKALRTDKGLTQKSLGDVVGLRPRTINDMEHGRIRTTLDRAVIFADFFDVSLDYLVGRSDNPNSHKAK